MFIIAPNRRVIKVVFDTLLQRGLHTPRSPVLETPLPFVRQWSRAPVHALTTLKAEDLCRNIFTNSDNTSQRSKLGNL
jgi:hypothetical protein